MCSSESHVTGHVDTCYASSWMYYAIEGCRTPSTSSSVAVASPSSAGTSTPPSSDNGSRDDRDARHDGFIAGTVIATISGVALIVTGLLLLWRRQPRRIVARSHELSNDCALVETVSVEKQMAKELWADHAVAEIGRNSTFEDSRRTSIEKAGLEDR